MRQRDGGGIYTTHTYHMNRKNLGLWYATRKLHALFSLFLHLSPSLSSIIYGLCVWGGGGWLQMSGKFSFIKYINDYHLDIL